MSQWASMHTVPRGYRFLNVGEIIEGTDLFCINTGHGDPENIGDYVVVRQYALGDVGGAVRTYHVPFLRRAVTLKGNICLS